MPRVIDISIRARDDTEAAARSVALNNKKMAADVIDAGLRIERSTRGLAQAQERYGHDSIEARSAAMELTRAQHHAEEVTDSLRNATERQTRSVDDASHSAGKFKEHLSKVSAYMGGMFAAHVIEKGAEAFKGMVEGAVESASGLGESINAVQKIFGNQSDAIVTWGQKSAESYGLSQRAFNEMSTPMGAILKNSGMSMKDVAKNTIDLTKRAADMASVFNVDVPDALEAINSGLKGEADPLERFGVGLSAANVQAEALSEGLGKSTIDIEKVKTAHLRAEIAQRNYTSAVKTHGESSTQALSAHAALISAGTNLEKVMKGGTVHISAADSATARLNLIMKQTKSSAGDFTQTSDQLANSTRIQEAKMENLQATIGKKMLPVVLLLTKAKMALVQILADKVVPALSKVADWFQKNPTLMRIAAIIIGVVLVGAFVAWAAAAGAAAVATIAATWPILAIIAIIAALVVGFIYLYKHCDNFRKIVDIVVKGSKIAFGILVEVFKSVVAWVEAHWPAISYALQAPIKLAVSKINEVWNKMKSACSSVMDAVIFIFVTLPDKIASSVGNLGKLLYNKGRDVITGFWTGLKDIWNSVTGWISGLGGWIKDHKGPMSVDKNLLRPAGHAIMTSLWDGLKAGAGPIGGWLSSFTSGLSGGGGGGGNGGAGVQRWRSVALQALALTHSPAGWIDSLLRRMNQESGGNPNAINRTDSNAMAGTPSIGLMQTIGPTFSHYAGALRGRGITDPLANIVASINYANAAYGSAPNGWNRSGGYDRGGWLMPGTTLATNLTGRPEPVGWGFMKGLGHSGGPTRLEIVGGNDSAFGIALAELIRKFVRVRGGDVQRALGA